MAIDEKHFHETLKKTRELLRLAQRKDTEHQHTMRLMDFEAEINLLAEQARISPAESRQLAGKLLFIQQTLRSLRFYVRARTSQRAQEQQQKRQQQTQEQAGAQQEQRRQPPRASAVGQNYYEILGVSPQATEAEIRKAYHTKLKEYHPDRHQNTEFEWVRQQAEAMTRLLSEAYEVLVHEDQRRRYDQRQQQARS